MNYYLTTVSHGTTGVKTITCGFQPVRAKITVSTKFGGQNMNHQSVGVTDGTNQICDMWVNDGAGNLYTDRYTDRLVTQWERSGGSWVEKTKASFDSFTSTEFKYNVLVADANYQYLVEIEG